MSILFYFQALIFLKLTNTVASHFRVTPKGIIVEVGSQATFNCTISQHNHTVNWLFTSNQKGILPQEIYRTAKTQNNVESRNDVFHSKDGIYSVDISENGQHNLVIHSVQASHAGIYQCESPSQSFARPVVAELVVLKVPLKCEVFVRRASSCTESSTTEGEIPLATGDSFIIICTVEFAEKVFHSVQWKSSDGLFTCSDTIVDKTVHKFTTSLKTILSKTVIGDSARLRYVFELKASSSEKHRCLIQMHRH